MSDLMPVGVGGHGLLLAPHCPCRIAHLENGSLLVQPLTHKPGALPPVAAVATGTRGAHGEATRLPDDTMPTWRYGEGGPTIALGNGAQRIDEVFAQIDIIPSGDGAPWALLGPGFWIDFPPGFTVDSTTSPDDPFFQLTQKGDERDAVIQFQGRPVPAHAMRFPPDATEATLEGLAGTIRLATRRYQHEGVAWSQRLYTLPIADDATIMMLAQAPHPQSEQMLISADTMAGSFEPMRR